ncbi:MAG: hypothetical protein ABIS06_11245 [Vicinamibacterales bacterium]
MSAQRIVPPARSKSRFVATLIAVIVVGVLAGCGGYTVGLRSADERRIVMSAEAPGRIPRVTFVRETRCQGQPCQTLWVGSSRSSAARVAQLAPSDTVEEITWSADGSLVGFVVNGYQLRVYDPEKLKLRTEVDLLEADRRPTSRIARGVTFSTNGAAVTFDDCPRHTSGCKSGLIAVR